jgi:hypothetical protein
MKTQSLEHCSCAARYSSVSTSEMTSNVQFPHAVYAQHLAGICNMCLVIDLCTVEIMCAMYSTKLKDKPKTNKHTVYTKEQANTAMLSHE